MSWWGGGENTPLLFSASSSLPPNASRSIYSCGHAHVTPCVCVSFQSEIVVLMSQSGKTRRQIETWFRLRRSQDRPCQTKKFGEAAWVFPTVTKQLISPHTQPDCLLTRCRLGGSLTVVIITLHHPGGDSSSTWHRSQLDWPVWLM